jgi:hypothetical protein
LEWRSRSGEAQPVVEERGDYLHPSLSPDGRRLAVVAREGIRSNIWLITLPGGERTRLTFEGSNGSPLWHPGGEHLAFGSNRAGTTDIYWMPVDGSGPAELLVASEWGLVPTSWSPDGEHLLYVEITNQQGPDIRVVSMQDRTDREYVATPANEVQAQFSPDGRWVAYRSDESGSGTFEVFVEPFPHQAGGKRQISQDGGFEPLWGAGGSEIFYRLPGRVLAVDLDSQGGLRASVPRVLFEGPYRLRLTAKPDYAYDASSDRFLMLASDPLDTLTELVLIQGWFEELERLVTTGR